MKRIFIILALLASPAWAQAYVDVKPYATINATDGSDYAQQQEQNREQMESQQREIQQLQQQQNRVQYVPMYGNGTEATQ